MLIIKNSFDKVRFIIQYFKESYFTSILYLHFYDFYLYFRLIQISSSIINYVNNSFDL